MLNKSDLKAIKGVFDEAFDRKFAKAFSNSIGEFFDHIMVPYFDARFKESEEDHDDIFRKLDRNQEEHDQMFVKLDSIEKKVDGHDPRIKKIEKTLQVS